MKAGDVICPECGLAIDNAFCAGCNSDYFDGAMDELLVAVPLKELDRALRKARIEYVRGLPPSERPDEAENWAEFEALADAVARRGR